MPTLLGFDYGPRKIGVAVGQTVTGSATPLTTLRSRGERPDWPGIEALVREWQPSAAVVGLPFQMDDTEVDWSPLSIASPASSRDASGCRCIWSTSA